MSSTTTSKQTTMTLPTPNMIITYPIGSDVDAGALFLFGDSGAPNIAVLCAGFPDDHENFLPFAVNLAAAAECYVGVTCLPGYDDRIGRPYTAHKAAGYTFEEMYTAMKEAVAALRAASTYTGKDGLQKAKLTGVFHDWGVAPGSMYCNRMIEEDVTGNKEKNNMCLDKMVLFDVMGPPHPDTPQDEIPVVPADSIYKTVVTLTYRIIFATSFGIRRYISKALAQVYAGLSLTFLDLFKLGPTYDIDAKVMEARQTPISLDRLLYMAYPYYNMFKAISSSTMEREFRGMSLPKDLVKTPVLYMYGSNKRIHFHDERSLLILKKEEEERRSKSKAVAVEGAGHWLYIHKPDLCLKEVTKFVLDA